MTRKSMMYCHQRVGLFCAVAFTSLGNLRGQSVADHVNAVEKGLSIGTVIAGRPQPGMNLMERMAYHHVPGVSVAVIHQGRIEWARGYGVLQTDGPPVRDTTLFSAASISKAVTAVAVLRLVQEGKLVLDRDVNSYLKQWKLPANELTAQRPVTVRMLLNHTSGIEESLGMIYSPSNMPTLTQMLNGEKPASNAPVQVKTVPGTKFEYSNAGYLVLQALVMDVSGKPFAESMRSLVFTPIGMTHSTFEQPLPGEYSLNAASAFGWNSKTGVLPQNFVQANLAAAGLWTTPTDLAKIILEIVNANAGRRSAMLSKKTARIMLTPGMGFPVHAQGKVFGGAEHWGLGIELGGQPGHVFLDHGGSAVYEGFMFSYLNGEGMVVMTNSMSGFRVAHEILTGAASVYQWPDFKNEEHPTFPVEKQDLEKFVGTYGDSIRIANLGDSLQCDLLPEKKQIRLYPSSPNRFFSLDVAEELEFHSTSLNGSVENVDVITPTFRYPLLRTK